MQFFPAQALLFLGLQVCQQILLAGARLVYSRGFTATGLMDILEEADIPKGSFYYYFKSKEEILQTLIDNFIDEAVELAKRYARRVLAFNAGRLVFDGPVERLDDACAGVRRNAQSRPPPRSAA